MATPVLLKRLGSERRWALALFLTAAAIIFGAQFALRSGADAGDAGSRAPSNQDGSP